MQPEPNIPRLDAMNIIVGTAGWTIAREHSEAFAAGGSSLERYATCFSGVEINSSFHREHRLSTWQRWRASVPGHFRFAVKMPKSITHLRKLDDCAGLLTEFLDQAGALGPQLAVILVQLPPSFAFDAALAGTFFKMLGSSTPVLLACEPRHASWFDAGADALLVDHGVARVAADPARVPAAAVPGGWRGLSYFRLHGSPRMYRSSYDAQQLETYSSLIQSAGTRGDCWCMFDNTASCAATGNALALSEMLGIMVPPRPSETSGTE